MLNNGQRSGAVSSLTIFQVKKASMDGGFHVALDARTHARAHTHIHTYTHTHLTHIGLKCHLITGHLSQDRA